MKSQKFNLRKISDVFWVLEKITNKWDFNGLKGVTLDILKYCFKDLTALFLIVKSYIQVDKTVIYDFIPRKKSCVSTLIQKKLTKPEREFC